MIIECASEVRENAFFSKRAKFLILAMIHQVTHILTAIQISNNKACCTGHVVMRSINSHSITIVVR